jgi:molybdopterin molybdotransferase
MVRGLSGSERLATPNIAMMKLAEARAAARSQIVRSVPLEEVKLVDARGRYLAADLVAPIDLPSSDRAAVDGFAARRKDLAPDKRSPLELVGSAAAGRRFDGRLGERQSVRIFTGAAMPAGADTVIMQEHCNIYENLVVVPPRPETRENCRRRGEDVRAGSTVARAGCRLLSQHVALAAALGFDVVQVFRRLRVGLLSTGNEVHETGVPIAEHQIWDANRWLLRGLIESLGCEVTDLGIAPDDVDEIERTLSTVAQDLDLLITSGGMSVSDEDHVRSVIRRRGSLDIWRLAIKPGKPVGFGDIDDCPILALPGNPVAAAVTFIAFGRSIVLGLAGGIDQSPRSIRLPAGFSRRKKPGWRQYLLGVVRQGQDGLSTAVAVEKQGSAMLSSLVEAHGFIVLEEETENISFGEPVEYMQLSAVLE